MLNEKLKGQLKSKDFWITLFGILLSVIVFLVILYFRSGAFTKPLK